MGNFVKVSYLLCESEMVVVNYIFVMIEVINFLNKIIVVWCVEIG